ADSMATASAVTAIGTNVADMPSAYEADGEVHRLTANALELAPTGGDATAANQTTILSTITTMQGNLTSILEDTGTTIPATIADLPTNAELATALGAADDATLAAIAGIEVSVDLGNIESQLDNIEATLDGLSAVTSPVSPVLQHDIADHFVFKFSG